MGVRIQDVSKKYGAVTALDNFSLDVGSGELVALVGPSGCGKSTLLKIIAGFLAADTGAIEIDARRVNDLPIRERGIAYVMEKLGLYPHLSVFENIAYPLRVRRLSGNEIQKRVRSICEVTGIAGLEQRQPSELSGGQRQRVAVARALVRDDARVLLADECFSDLDAQLRYQLRGEFRSWQRHRQLTCIFVTHDQEEALALGDRVAVMQSGRVEQVGTPQEVYNHPETLFAAQFVGRPSMNLLSVVEGDGRLNDFGCLALGRRSLSVTSKPEWLLGFRPEDVQVLSDGNAGIPAFVEFTEPMNPDTLVHLAVAESHERIVARLRNVGHLHPGQAVKLKIEESRCHFFDRQTGVRLSINE